MNGAAERDRSAIIKRVEIAAPCTLAFNTFVAQLGAWWRLERLSRRRGTRAVGLTLEPWLGGAVLETSATGERLAWGEVIGIAEPRRLLIRWHLGRPIETEVELRVDPIGGDRTQFTLVHSGWDRLETAGATVERAGYAQGWELILAGAFRRCVMAVQAGAMR